MIFVFFYSLYHHTNNSISTIGYLFMRGITFLSRDKLWAVTLQRVTYILLSCDLIFMCVWFFIFKEAFEVWCVML